MNYLPLFMRLTGNRVTDAWEHQWNSVKGAQILEDGATGNETVPYSIYIAYDRQTMDYCILSVTDYKTSIEYQLVNPQCYELYRKEHEASLEDSSGEITTIFLETIEDFEEKASAIVAGKPYDTRIIVPVELPTDVLEAISKLADAKHMDINDFASEILCNSAQRTIDAQAPHG